MRLGQAPWLRALLRARSSGRAALRRRRGPDATVAHWPERIESDVCPACGSEAVGTLQAIPGVALARISGGRLEWTGGTEIEWEGSEAVPCERGVVLACAKCGERWVHPAVVLEEP